MKRFLVVKIEGSNAAEVDEEMRTFLSMSKSTLGFGPDTGAYLSVHVEPVKQDLGEVVRNGIAKRTHTIHQLLHPEENPQLSLSQYDV